MAAVNLHSDHISSFAPLSSDMQTETLQERIDRCYMEYRTSLPSVLRTNLSNVSYYEGPEACTLPGAANLFFIPVDGFYMIKGLMQALKHGDRESIKDAGLRMLGAPVSLVNAIGNWLYFGLFLKLISISLVALNATCITGIALCVVECIVEGVNLKRQFEIKDLFTDPVKHFLSEKDPQVAIEDFKKEIKSDSKTYALLLENGLEEKLKKLEQSEDFPPAFEEFQAYIFTHVLEQMGDKYFRLQDNHLRKIERQIKYLDPKEITDKMIKSHFDTKLCERKSKLSRRVRPWMANEVDKKIFSIMKDLKKDSVTLKNRGLENAKELLRNVDIQNKKKTILHALGIIAFTLTIIGLILSLAGCPILIPIIITSIAGLFGLARFVLAKGWLDTKGWLTFDYRPLLPKFIRPHSVYPNYYVKLRSRNLKAL